MACEYCDIISGKKKGMLLFEDDKAIAVLSENPATLGHILLMPKEHYPIIEQVPDYIVAHLSNVANKLSVCAFEGMNALGTNILVNNGVAGGQKSAHFMVHIVPRREGDSINFTWQPRQIPPEEFSAIELKLKEGAKGIGEFEKEKPKPIIKDREPPLIKKEELLIKALDRIP